MMRTALVERQADAPPSTQPSGSGLGYLSLSTAVFGLGGLGVVGLTRMLAESLQPHFPRVATTETRGIAQRRAPVRSIIRAGSDVRSATTPNSSIDLVVALESSEALRAAQFMQPGTRCLHADLTIPCSGARLNQHDTFPDAQAVRTLLQRRGVEVISLDISSWLRSRSMSDVLVSTAAFGALATIIGLSVDTCEQLLLRRLAGALREDNRAAFRFGANHAHLADQSKPVRPMQHPSSVHSESGLMPLPA